MNQEDVKLAIIGLGYVGLPLAIEFGKIQSVIGFDINEKRISELKQHIDNTLESTKEELVSAKSLSFTSSVDDLIECNCYIITVPTPVNNQKQPDLTPLLAATKMVGGVLSKGDVVIYESTVYPGATEEDCVPLLESSSGLKFNLDFFCGYSPERINPGDKNHRLQTIVKVTSGSTPKYSEFVDQLYSKIILAGTYKAPSIKVAEAAKVIENTQRDLNIALINELSIIFNKLGIDTEEVLKAAGTKWNFFALQARFGWGHCIGVDPYYLTHKAQSIGYTPEVILAGRRVNDGMGLYIATNFVKELLKRNVNLDKSRVLIMGLTFKENCPDLRNSKVPDIYHELLDYGLKVDVFDPWVSNEESLNEYGIELIDTLTPDIYDGVVVAVSHNEFVDMGSSSIKSLCKEEHIIYDVKSIFKSQRNIRRL